jgi:LacI family transcriptional regulator
MTSIREVAERAGVSLGTVSNVLNHPELVTETTRQRVQLAINELGFIRNGSAHQLRAGHSRSLGLVVLDVTNPFYPEVARGVEDAANEAGYAVILCNSDFSLDKEGRYLRMLEEKRVQGVLITPVQRDAGYLQPLRKRGVSVVLLDRPSRIRDLCWVAVDNVRGGELVATHLLEQGHTHFGFINGPLWIRQYADRRQGFRRAIKAAGLDPNEAIVEITRLAQNAREGEASVAELLHARITPTAVFCANDYLALGLMRGLAQRGIAIPDDIALVGYDDVEFASVLLTPLTSIRQPKYQLGRAAAELLLAEAASSATHEHKHIMYEPELIVRASSSSRTTY